VLIVVPSSESKREAPARGAPVSLDALSFPSLGSTRAAILDALVETSSRPDAFRRLQVGPSLAGEVERNTRLRDLPARPALEVYTGVVHGGLDAASLSTAARQRAARWVVVASSLWGLLRPMDRIPPYRLQICARLVGVDRLEPVWREVLPPVLAEAAGPRGVILDLRSTSYQAAGMPAGEGDRTVTLRVDGEAGRPGNVIVKQVRGQAARYLLEATGEAPRNPVELAALLGERWPARLSEPERPGKPWTLTLVVRS
jgi:uncharacterized protein